ncbi:hypothetical protein Y1Q_0018619 [Alligator mississippiensis]|uniref:Uncharacterized protein n=1 Tax=Alligator mississippiensis TaxID=8496 RepID=A0A151NSC9_ALLMI|nr:hypothetical protein Y1Q_0018619 [Alligator mississippiensis]
MPSTGEEDYRVGWKSGNSHQSCVQIYGPTSSKLLGNYHQRNSSCDIVIVKPRTWAPDQGTASILKQLQEEDSIKAGSA